MSALATIKMGLLLAHLKLGSIFTTDKTYPKIGGKKMRTTDAFKIGMELGRIRGALDAWEESKHPRADNGQFTSGSGSSGGGGSSIKPKVITKTGGVTSVSGGGSRGQLNITRKGNESYVMLQATKKDGSWGKPQMTKLMFKEELENPELALKRIQKLNPGRKWRFALE